MKRFRYFSILCIILLGAACSAPLVLKSHWVAEEESTSTTFNQTPAVYLFPKDNISLKIFNNQKELNLIFETNSTFTIEKILRLGMSVWLDPAGEKRKEVGVHFPLPLEDQKSLSLNFDPKKITNNQLNRVYQNITEIELVNFKEDETLIISTAEKDEGVQIKLYSLENKLFRYQLRIDMNRILPEELPTTSIQTMSIGISSVNEPDSEYYSALSSREVLKRKMDQLKAGETTEVEIAEHWVNFHLALPQ